MLWFLDDYRVLFRAGRVPSGGVFPDNCREILLHMLKASGLVEIPNKAVKVAVEKITSRD